MNTVSGWELHPWTAGSYQNHSCIPVSIGVTVVNMYLVTFELIRGYAHVGLSTDPLARSPGENCEGCPPRVMPDPLVATLPSLNWCLPLSSDDTSFSMVC
jgi:hypothetical protein